MATNFKVGDKVRFREEWREMHNEVADHSMWEGRFPPFEGVYELEAVKACEVHSLQTQMVVIKGYHLLREDEYMGAEWFELAATEEEHA